jgi:hypothetical protein
MTIESRSIEIPEFRRLRSEEAIEALCYYILELEEQRGKELTDKQTNIMIKFARGLISSIGAEKRFDASDKRMRLVIELDKKIIEIPRYPPIPLKLR